MSKPESLVRSINGLDVLNPSQFMDGLRPLPVQEKLIGGLALAGCESWDEEGRYIKDSTVNIAGIGGIPLGAEHLSDEEVAAQIQQFAAGSEDMMELSAGFSYLNSGNLERGALLGRVTELGHLSVAHTVSVNMIVAGVSTAVENEFNSQRDIAHLSRLTVARTSVQNKPPVMVDDPEQLEATRAIVETVDEQVAAIKTIPGMSREERFDLYERRNTLYPASKASIFMLSGSLRNIGKLISQKDDDGKEREYRAVLKKIEGQVSKIWPSIFN
jgi:hypothetical protein